MGVHGLWRLIEPSGKPVPLETLENKILAVDISIWLHQAIKGFQDSRGAPLPNAHLLGIYHRVCKLLYFRIRPVFVFDGGVPVLKKQTIAKRNQLKTKILNDADNIQAKLLNILLKHSAVKNVIGENSDAVPKSTATEKNNDKEDMFVLPDKSASELDTTVDSSCSSDDESSSSPSKHWDLHTIDEKSEHFRSLPADVRHEILTEIMETRKQSSWGRLHELPTHSGDFSSFQMKRLLKRYSVQVSLEEAQKEMGGHTLSLGELEALLTEEGIVTVASNAASSRIASCADTRYLLIKDVKKEMENAKKAKEKNAETDVDTNVNIISQESSSSSSFIDTVSKDSEYESDLAAAIQLSLQDQPSTSKDVACSKELSYLENFNDGDFESESESDEEKSFSLLAQAKSYMMEYSGLTPNEIAKILKNGQKEKSNKKQNIIEKPRETTSHEDCVKSYKKDNILDTIKENIEKLGDKELSKESNDTNSEKILNYTENIKEISTEKQATCINSSESIQLTDTDLKAKDISEVINKHNADDIQKINNNSVEIMSDSDDNDFVDVTESNKQIITDDPLHKNTRENITENISKQEDNTKNISADSVQVMSDSDESDFVEVNEILNKQKPETNKNLLEIVINPKENLEDDLFSDIFETNQQEIKDQSASVPVEQNNSDITKEIVTVATETEVVSSVIEENKVTEHISTKHNVNSDCTEPIVQPGKPKLTVEELNAIKNDLVVEQQQLIVERNTKERMAGNITDQMYHEAQELLELFGVPYIIAPMEAEAQCAFLNEIDLTDGTITDDSDIWLFGGKTVYKNFFNHNKHVLEFRSENIEHHFKLTREHLILLALLVGSDYTLGIQGIGPVTALEILASFPPLKDTNVTVLTQNELISGLTEFRRWLSDGRAVGVGRTALKSKLRNVTVSEGFPNLQVVQAYLQPKVETSRDRFTWGKPDIVGLIDFAKEKFGWTKLKSEEILKPVIRRLEEKHVQKSIKDYFATKHKIYIDSTQNKMSKRVKTAVSRMGKNPSEASEPAKPKKRTTRKHKTDDQSLEKNKTADVKTSAPKRKPREKKTIEHIEEFIPQRERDKNDALRNKLKAIEIFRKSKQGPGFVKKRPQVIRKLKEDAELSESSSSD